jgi:hypothetical protein
MYIYDQGRISGAPLGIGQLDALGKSNKNSAIQLEDEIAKLDAKKHWSGVDRTYEEWLKVGDEKWAIHQKAARAAMMLGKADTRYKRLWTAHAFIKDAEGPSGERDKMKKELILLGDKWLHVVIHLTRKSSASLEQPGGGYDRPEGENEAIKLAQEKLRIDRTFDGLLPIGDYVISGQRQFLASNHSWSRVWAIHYYQTKDGFFEKKFYWRRPTSAVDPPLHQKS